MSFDFSGVFTTQQWTAFKAFTIIQKSEVKGRMLWLKREIIRIGVFKTLYDGNEPVGFYASPNNSYGAKLLYAYRALGGVPEKDMMLRTKDKPVYLKKSVQRGTNYDWKSGYGIEFSDGRVIRNENVDATDVANRINAIKSWQLEPIKFKREQLEYKIKKAIDYSDQIVEEYERLKKVLDGAVDDYVILVDLYINDPDNIQIFEGDRFGLRLEGDGDDPLYP